MTKLCCFNLDNPNIFAFKHHSQLSPLTGMCGPKLSRFEHAGWAITLLVPCWNSYHWI